MTASQVRHSFQWRISCRHLFNTYSWRQQSATHPCTDQNRALQCPVPHISGNVLPLKAPLVGFASHVPGILVSRQRGLHILGLSTSGPPHPFGSSISITYNLNSPDSFSSPHIHDGIAVVLEAPAPSPL